MRTCASQGRRAEFARRLADWALSLGFRRVLLLTSSHAHTRADTQLQSSMPQLAHFRLGSSAATVATALSIPHLGMQPRHGCAAGAADQSDSLATVHLPSAPAAAAAAGTGAEESKSRLHREGEGEVAAVRGGGITGPFFRYLEAGAGTAAGVEVLGLVWYAAEGDNAGDGRQMALVAERALAEWTGSKSQVQWRQPAAWDALARGRAPEEEELYE